LVEIVSLAQGGADLPDFIKGLFGYAYGYCFALGHYLKIPSYPSCNTLQAFLSIQTLLHVFVLLIIALACTKIARPVKKVSLLWAKTGLRSYV